MLVQGIYLLLERLKFPVYRRLFRRVQLLHAEAKPAKAAQLPLGECSSLWRPVHVLPSHPIQPLDSISKARSPGVSGQPRRSATVPSVLASGLWSSCCCGESNASDLPTRELQVLASLATQHWCWLTQGAVLCRAVPAGAAVAGGGPGHGRGGVHHRQPDLQEIRQGVHLPQESGELLRRGYLIARLATPTRL
jgi:hypothetical protein